MSLDNINENDQQVGSQVDETNLDENGLFGTQEPPQVKEEEVQGDEVSREDYLKEFFKEDDSEEFKTYVNQTADKFDLKGKDIDLVANIYKDYEQTVNEANEHRLQEEISKLTPIEKQEIGGVLEYWEQTLGEGSEQFLDGMFSTAEGFRYGKQMMELAGQSLPAYSNTVTKVQALTSDELNSFREKINDAAKEGNFKNVERYKEEMKEAIRSRGSSNLKKDLYDFIK